MEEPTSVDPKLLECVAEFDVDCGFEFDLVFTEVFALSKVDIRSVRL